MNLDIYYNSTPIDELDKAIIECLKKLGFKETGSGYDFKLEKRDLSFTIDDS